MTGIEFEYRPEDVEGGNKIVLPEKENHRVRFYGAVLSCEVAGGDVTVSIQDTTPNTIAGDYNVKVLSTPSIHITLDGGWFDGAVGKGLQVTVSVQTTVAGIIYAEYVAKDGADIGERASQAGP
jgi:hypothetical protein